MRFTQYTVQRLFSTSDSYSIPLYQRAYSWQKENWSVFFNDIKEQIGRDNTYAYGNLLLEEITQGDYEIIDGQQRLTTLIIFMRSLYDALKNQGVEQKELDIISNMFLYNQLYNVQKLNPIEVDRPIFNSLIINLNNNVYNQINSNSQKAIKNAKDYFDGVLKDYDKDSLIQIKNIIYNSNINTLVLEGKKEAALMFELQNNRGRDLTNMEKLKSFFMYQIYINSTNTETDRNIEEISDLFKQIYSVVYDIPVLDEDSILIYHCFTYLKVSYAYRNLEHLKEELNASSDKILWIKKFTQELANTFNNLKKLSLEKDSYRFYKKLLDIREQDKLNPFVYPFIIKGLKYSLDENIKLDLNKLFEILEILVFRFHLISTKAEINSRLKDVLISFEGNLNDLKEALDRKLEETHYWSKARMENALNGWMYDNPVLNYLLWEYENSLQRKGYSVSNTKIENEQIEHISPQNPTNGDPIATGYEVDLNNRYSEEYIRTRINCLGNLMLIGGSHNASIGNKPFVDKYNTFIKNNALHQHTELEDFLTNGVIEWKNEQIEKRLNKLVTYAMKRWDFKNIK